MTAIRKTVQDKLTHHYDRYHDSAYLGMDPLTVVHRFRASGSQSLEIAALVAACFSYGQVENIIKLLNALFERVDGDLSDFTMTTGLAAKKKSFTGLKYRFNNGMDIALLFEVIKRAKQENGTLGALFSQGWHEGDPNVRNALDCFVSQLNRWAGNPDKGDYPGFSFLLSSPHSGSACKRMCMFLRWMIRKDDGIDLGLWTQMIPPSALVIPVDTHVAAAARSLKLTSRNSVDWVMAEEITTALKSIDPHDPVRFDFSLCRAGMVRSRQGKRNAS